MDLNFIRRHVPTSASILDIGAVPPLLSALLLKEGYTKITVADPTASTFHSFFNRHSIQHVDLDVLNTNDVSNLGTFDLVCFNEVIEHLSGNLIEVLQKVADRVAPGGHLMVTTPNLRSLSGIYAILGCNSGLASKPFETVRMQYERSSAKYGYFGHLREFTPNEVRDLVSSFGLNHYKSAFQANYLRPSIPHKAIYLLEVLFPKLRLFGKHLFQRPSADASDTISKKVLPSETR